MMKLSIVLLLYLSTGFVSGKIIPDWFQERFQVKNLEQDDSRGTKNDIDDSTLVASCTKALDALQINKDQPDKKSDLEGFPFVVHRNGEPEPCGVTPFSSEAMVQAIEALSGDCPNADLNKYQLESFLTDYFAKQLSSNACGSTDDNNAPQGFLGFCDMGPKRTVVQLDYDKLVRVPSGSLPCRFFTREGARISSLQDLKTLAQKAKQSTSTKQEKCEDDRETCAAGPALHLYAVPAGRVFMFAPSHVGEVFEIPHVTGAKGEPISLEVLSLDPRVFDIHNFFSKDESDALIAKAVGEKSETHKLHRSTTGTVGASIFDKRTSENAWDTHGELALKIKRRCFETLGLDEYHEAQADGLQILRYNLTTAYTPHMDYLADKMGELPYDYESGGRGGNRFATILLYMSDLEEGAGGETVFPNAWPPGTPEEDQLELEDAITQLRESGDATMLKKGSWEEEMTAMCRSRLAARPKASRAVLFYSQKPNGAEDKMSWHGGCPVLRGTKWAANLWVWNAPRPEFEGRPLKPGVTEEEVQKKAEQLQATFRNSGKDSRFDKAELYYDEDGFFGKLGPNDPPIRVNTYETHVWNVRVDGKNLKTFHITNEKEQEFVV